MITCRSIYTILLFSCLVSMAWYLSVRFCMPGFTLDPFAITYMLVTEEIVYAEPPGVLVWNEVLMTWMLVVWSMSPVAWHTNRKMSPTFRCWELNSTSREGFWVWTTRIYVTEMYRKDTVMYTGTTKIYVTGMNRKDTVMYTGITKMLLE